MLDATWNHCVRRGVKFKFLSDRRSFFVLNGKGASRESGGKVATIYPPDDDELRLALEGLSAELAGEPGPYILSDVRWQDGPLYVRYGGFSSRTCLAGDGELRLAIEAEDGTLVPDRRDPFFHLPPGVKVPGFLEPHVHARTRGHGLDGLPYRIRRALHFSNGGGVYLAEHADGRTVVLKEARPFAALDRAGGDAVARLAREADALVRLADVPEVPGLHDRFTVGEHHFLAVEYVEAQTLTAWVATRNPLAAPSPDADDIARYRDDALALLDRIERLLGAVHDAGVVYGDLHPNNILVRPDGTVRMVDFEVSGDIADDSYRPPLRCPGFAPASAGTGAAVDRHALVMLRYWIFVPLHQVLELLPAKVAEFAAAAERHFDLPAGYGRGVLRALAESSAAAPPVPGEQERRDALGAPLEIRLDTADPNAAAIRASMAAAIRKSATPGRPDRLFPGGFEQFVHDGIGFAHGAAGVLWALSVSGAGHRPDHEEWLLEAVRRSPGRRPGFYDGLHGIAYVLDHLGHRDQALETLERALPLIPSLRGGNLFNGLAGVGLGLLRFADLTGDRALGDQAEQIAARLGSGVERGVLHGSGTTPAEPPGPADTGLLRGWSGVGLFFLRLHGHTADPAHLDLAGQAIRRDLRACRASTDGSLRVGTETEPVHGLERGAAGIAIAAGEFLMLGADDEIQAALPALLHACRPQLVPEASLFDGRAGQLAALARLCPDDADHAAARHLRRFTWHAVPYHRHLSFPRHYRLSMDLAHGTAGVLLAIAGAFDRRTPPLPFLKEHPPAPLTQAAPTRHWPSEATAAPEDADTRGMTLLDLQRLRPAR